MGRLILVLTMILLPLLCGAQNQREDQFKEAGVCARCHIISVAEWTISGHRKAAATCISCHGASRGHVLDERNTIKPDRVPQGAAIAGLCADCHKSGCPKSRQTASCENCHHVHALVDANKPRTAEESQSSRSAQALRYATLMKQGEQNIKETKWEAARADFLQALGERPGDARAAAKLRLCEHWLKPSLPGFDNAGDNRDPQTGLPREVSVAGLGIAMILAPGGEFEMGSDLFPNAVPTHTVRVKAFYLGKFEVTQAEWRAVMGSNPSYHQGASFPDADRMPVEQVSWQDCQAFVRKLNERVPGGGFRLPTEAEWEYAAQAPEQYHHTESAAPKAVGKGKPNRFGFYDMLGNVSEWCSSLYRPYPYSARDGREDPGAPGLRVLRGGGFADLERWVDSSARHSDRSDRRLRWNGIRLARNIPGED